LGICVFDVSDWADGERLAVRRLLIWALVLTCTLVLLLILPPLSRFPDVIRDVRTAATLIPQALPIAVPIAFVLSIAFGLPVRPAMGSVKMMLLAALAASLLSFATLVWGLPAGSDAFRKIVAESTPPEYRDDFPAQKGPGEMTLSELRRGAAAVSPQSGSSLHYSWQFHLRAALAAASLALAAFLIAVPASTRRARGLFALASCLTYWALLYMGQSATLTRFVTPMVGAWLPNLVFVAAALLVVSTRSSRLRDSMAATQ
jgi:lipopolysaccharide export LptBFGC system permease protein LptF